MEVRSVGRQPLTDEQIAQSELPDSLLDKPKYSPSGEVCLFTALSVSSKFTLIAAAGAVLGGLGIGAYKMAERIMRK